MFNSTISQTFTTLYYLLNVINKLNTLPSNLHVSYQVLCSLKIWFAFFKTSFHLELRANERKLRIFFFSGQDLLILYAID